MRDGAPGSAWKAPPNAAFVPTLVIHGDRDRTVNPVNAEQIIEQARLAAGDGPLPLVESPARRLAGARHAYVLRDYARGGKAILRRISVEDLDHAWSGGDGRHPFNDPDGPDASRLIWDFVKDFRRLPDGSHEWHRPWRLSLSAIRGWLRAKGH
jgi:poly(3-hydroxybutyrate) depolymerase